MKLNVKLKNQLMTSREVGGVLMLLTLLMGCFAFTGKINNSEGKGGLDDLIVVAISSSSSDFSDGIEANSQSVLNEFVSNKVFFERCKSRKLFFTINEILFEGVDFSFLDDDTNNDAATIFCNLKYQSIHMAEVIFIPRLATKNILVINYSAHEKYQA